MPSDDLFHQFNPFGLHLDTKSIAEIFRVRNHHARLRDDWVAIQEHLRGNTTRDPHRLRHGGIAVRIAQELECSCDGVLYMY